MKTIFFSLICFFISAIGLSQIDVFKVIGSLAIDGQLEEPFWLLDNELEVNINNTNNTASFGVLWDDDYIYIGIIVEDGTLCVNRRMGWNDDGVEICIDGDYSQGASFDEYDRHFIKPIKSYWIQEKDGQLQEGVIHQWMQTENGYSMEFAIPWDNFNISPSADLNIGLNIVVNDDDNCSSSNTMSQLLWSGNSSYYNSSEDWGTITLSNQTVYYDDYYLALISPNGGDFFIKNKTIEITWKNHGLSAIKIEYSLNEGDTWNTISSGVPAFNESYIWTIDSSPSNNYLIKISDDSLDEFNDISEATFTISEPLIPVEPLIPNEWDNYVWPYNAYFPEDPNGINGHVGNACGHASLARILHYWEFPIVGNDELTFIDNGGFTWSANFGETTYNYDHMPNYLPENCPEEDYTDVATLMYHAATSMHDVYGSGTNLENMGYAMSQYFHFEESNVAVRGDFTKAEWIQLVMNELDNGRVLLVQGMTLESYGNWHENNNIAGHWYHIDGYNEKGQLHIVIGYGDYDDYYDADSLSDFAFNLGVLSGLEPKLNGKELSLQSYNGGESFGAGEETEIFWNSINVTDIRVEYTLNSGQDWIVLANNIPALNESYAWTFPMVSSSDCKVKLSDVTEVNVYDKSSISFSIHPFELSLILPSEGSYFVPGDIINIEWENTPISEIDIQFSEDNGLNWEAIETNLLSSIGNYNWIAPNTNSDQCLIRILSSSNPDINDELNDVFIIGLSEPGGGPYSVDDNTTILFHFNENIEESASNFVADDYGIDKDYIENPNPDLNTAIYFNNSEADNQSFISVPYSSELSMTGDWTIDFWIYINSWDQSFNSWPIPIVLPTENWNANYYLEIPASLGQLKYGFNTSEGNVTLNSSPNSITTENWYHVALMHDDLNDSIKLRLSDSDFTLIEKQSASYNSGAIVNTGDQDLRIGAGFAGDNYFDGYLDELRISNCLRTFENELRANFMADKISGSIPLVVIFTDLSTEGESNIENWNWDFGDGNISNSQYPEHIYAETGIYTVALTVNDLSGNSETETKTNYVSVYAIPGEASNPNPADLATSVSVTSDLHWTNDENTENVDLYFGTNNPPTNMVLNNTAAIEAYNLPDLNPSTEYFWKVNSRNPFGFSEGPVWSFTTDMQTQSKEILPQQEVTFYPNPAKDIIFIETTEGLTASIYNLSGQLILKKEISDYTKINISHMNKGLYIITIENNNTNRTFKLLIN